MLDAGLRFVAEQGLSLSLEHLQMEELIQAARVSRTSSYRRWPTKDLFAADLLLTLARATELAGDVEGLRGALSSIPREVFDSLDSAQGRRDAVVEILRVVIDTDFRAMLSSTQWRSYIALRAAHLGLPDGELRSEVATALLDTGRRFTHARANAFRLLADVLDYRLRANRPQGWEQLSLTLDAVSTGMLIRAYSDPSAVTATTEIAAFDSTLARPWNPASLAAVGVILDAIEPDPAVVWDARRVAALRAQVDDIAEALTRLLVQARADDV